MRRRLSLGLLIGLLLGGSSLLAGTTPTTITFDLKDLAAAKERFKSNDPQTVTAVKVICEEADKQLDLPPLSVMNKEATPPSGDKHDYMSLSPYWWPDPSKSDGKPYIRKDGLVNPERSKYDLDALEPPGLGSNGVAEAVLNSEISFRAKIRMMGKNAIAKVEKVFLHIDVTKRPLRFGAGRCHPTIAHQHDLRFPTCLRCSFPIHRHLSFPRLFLQRKWVTAPGITVASGALNRVGKHST